MLEFLEQKARKKIIRTTLYGDQEFSLWELEILHTPLVQRLYNLKQLGFTDKVFPDAVHSRFNHVLGVTEMVDRMICQIERWLRSQPDRPLRFAVDRQNQNDNTRTEQIPCKTLADLLIARRSSIRLMGLLHDITHAAFGHTLEDEVRIFTEKHDDSPRQVRFFDALVAQLFYIWVTEARLRDVSSDTLRKLSALTLEAEEFGLWVEELREYLPQPSRTDLAARPRIGGRLQASFADRIRPRFRGASSSAA